MSCFLMCQISIVGRVTVSQLKTADISLNIRPLKKLLVTRLTRAHIADAKFAAILLHDCKKRQNL